MPKHYEKKVAEPIKKTNRSLDTHEQSSLDMRSLNTRRQAEVQPAQNSSLAQQHRLTTASLHIYIYQILPQISE